MDIYAKSVGIKGHERAFIIMSNSGMALFSTAVNNAMQEVLSSPHSWQASDALFSQRECNLMHNMLNSVNILNRTYLTPQIQKIPHRLVLVFLLRGGCSTQIHARKLDTSSWFQLPREVVRSTVMRCRTCTSLAVVCCSCEDR